MCLPTYLITNNIQIQVQKQTLKKILKKKSKIQNLLTTRNLNLKKNTLISLAQGQSENKEDFKDLVFDVLDKIEKTVEKKFFMTMRGIEVQKYKRLRVIIGDKDVKSPELAQKLDKSPFK